MKIYKIFIFDKKLGDWCEMRYPSKTIITFPTKEAAEQYVEEYPRGGANWSRTIREGNWQIIEEETKNPNKQKDNNENNQQKDNNEISRRNTP